MANKTRGIDILTDILRYCDTKTQTDIIVGLTPFLEKEKRPDLIAELRKQIVLFDDLAYANLEGIQMLLKYVSIKDLAVALMGAPESVVKNIASAMSKNMFSDLKAEASLRKNVSQSEISLVRERIMKEVKGLINENRLYIEKPDSKMIY
ncbi:MAG: hypothetical protein IKO19_03545 [Candidatus Riflebacteria bacterium]|nr:hypothetical protein [Candidatus Riflebacteria bacterium]